MMLAFLESGRNPAKPVITMLPDGYESLWRAIHQEEEIRVQFSTQIEKISHSDDGVTISFRRDGASISEDFEFLIIAAGLQTRLNYLEELSEEEKTLFAALDYDHLVVDNYLGPMPLARL